MPLVPRRAVTTSAAVALAVTLVLAGAVLARPDGVADTAGGTATVTGEDAAGSIERLQARLARLPGDYAG